MTLDHQTETDADEAPLLRVTALKKHFRVTGGLLSGARGKRTVKAVDGVDFALRAGTTLSLVGESGCGKSTTARMLLDLDKPSSGAIEFRGRPLNTLRGAAYRAYRRAVQTVFQDPSSSLSPRRRVRMLIAEPLVATRAMPRQQIDGWVRTLLDAVGLNPSVADAFPHELSGGMRQRVAVAQALATRPALIVLDEPVSALDVSIRAQIMNLLKDVQESFGVAYVLIAHDLATVRYLSHDVAAMYLGSVMETGTSDEFFTEPIHPYTLALVSAAVPVTPGQERERIILEGDTPSPTNPPAGCPFNTRCWLRKFVADPEKCVAERPPLALVDGTHRVACHYTEDAIAHPVRQRLVAEIAAGGGVEASPVVHDDRAAS